MGNHVSQFTDLSAHLSLCSKPHATQFQLNSATDFRAVVNANVNVPWDAWRGGECHSALRGAHRGARDIVTWSLHMRASAEKRSGHTWDRFYQIAVSALALYSTFITPCFLLCRAEPSYHRRGGLGMEPRERM